VRPWQARMRVLAIDDDIDDELVEHAIRAVKPMA
jgi:hypothetical protein